MTSEPQAGATKAASLTDEQCEEIRAKHETGFVGYGTLAQDYGCSKSTIRDIVKFRRRAYPRKRP